MRRTRRVIAFLVCAAMVLPLAACGPSASGEDITAYIDAFEAMDWDAMWTQVSPDAKVDKDTFLKKYDAIFTGLGVETVTVDDVAGPDEDGVYTYNATYKTKEYGEFTNAYRLTMRPGVADTGGVMWDYSLIFPEMEAGSSVRVSTVKASRGEIFAADGTLLAANGFAETVYMDTAKVQDITAVTAAAAPITGLTATKITEKFNTAQKNNTPVVALGAFAPGTLTQEQRESLLAVPGLGIDDKLYTPIREYPLGESASHMVGYMGYPLDEEGQAAAEKAGVSGLEMAYNEQLKGKDGKIVYIEDKWGKNIRTLWEQKMQEGQDLRLTLSTNLQQTAYNALSMNLDYTKGQSGVAIVMNAETGFVEAMATYPSYDDNLFTFGLSKDKWDFLQAPTSNQPLFFRATQGQYPPGSVIKPFTAAAALESGTVTPDTVFEGEIIENKWTPTDPGWDGRYVTRIEDSGTPLKLYNALTKSDNIYFAYIAMKMGAEKFTEYMERVGLESAVPFDLPVKDANLINQDNQMTMSRLADSGYGQGELLATPLQMAAMYTAFANGTGDMMKPVLVDKLCQADGLDYKTVSQTEPSVWIDGAVQQSSLDILTPMLLAVVEDGTGKGARVSGVQIAGKTGTAEKFDDKSREISWFAGYWMNQSYKRLVIVMVDVATEEGPVKFQIAKTLLTP